MTIPSDKLLVGYDYDAWYGYADKVHVTIDVSTKNNSQTGNGIINWTLS